MSEDQERPIKQNKKRTTIQIRISKTKKQEWETFVKDLKKLKSLS